MKKDFNLIEIHNLNFYRNNNIIFHNINMQFQYGKITAIMGPSGVGKTTLLRLIGGQLEPNKGEIWIENNNIPALSRKQLYEVRKKISMLFQSGALFTDNNVYENVAFPLKMHTSLPKKILHTIVLMKLETVGLRDAALLMPSELSGGMAHRVALARAIALDPQLIMFDEPFAGQDPININILTKLIKKLNYALNITCIIVSHDILEVLRIADYGYIFDKHQIIAKGTSIELQNSSDLYVKQFISGIIDNKIPFNYPVKDYKAQLLGDNIVKI